MPVTNIASVDEHERRAEDRPDADVVGRLAAAAEDDRDDRDHRLGQRGADGGEDRPDRALGQLELAPEPLDAVREQLGAEQDDEEGDDQDQDVQSAGELLPRRRSRAITTRTSDRRRAPAAARRDGEKPTRGDDDASDRQCHDQDDTEPQEAARAEGADPPGCSRHRTAGTRRTSGSMPSRASARRRRGPGRSRRRCRPRGAARSTASIAVAASRVRRPAAPSPLISPSARCASRTPCRGRHDEQPRSTRTSIRWAMRDPRLAPTNTPSAVGPAM